MWWGTYGYSSDRPSDALDTKYMPRLINHDENKLFYSMTCIMLLFIIDCRYSYQLPGAVLCFTPYLEHLILPVTAALMHLIHVCGECIYMSLQHETRSYPMYHIINDLYLCYNYVVMFYNMIDNGTDNLTSSGFIHQLITMHWQSIALDRTSNIMSPELFSTSNFMSTCCNGLYV